MRQIIPFKKDLLFKTMISEITSISLEHNLGLSEDSVVSGEFIISGQYKINSNSPKAEDFFYSVPFEIAIDDDYNLDNIKIDIDDFYYDVVDNNILKVNIDVAIDGIEEKELMDTSQMDIEEERGKDVIMINNKERETDSVVSTEKPITSDEIKEKVKSLFDSFDDSGETFSTYLVYIVRDNDTLESILLKYNKTRDELAEYNDLENITIGTKLIIPATVKYE